MARIPLLAVGVVLMLGLAACGPGLKAPVPPDGGKVVVSVVFDYGITEDTDAEKAKQLTQVGEYFAADLKKRFDKNGYEIETLEAADQFTPGPNKFLLTVKVLSYNPGAKGARVAGALLGGYAGMAMANAAEARLAASYRLTGESGKLAGGELNEGSGSSDWPAAVQKVSLLILKGSAKAIQGVYKK